MQGGARLVCHRVEEGAELAGDVHFASKVSIQPVCEAGNDEDEEGGGGGGGRAQEVGWAGGSGTGTALRASSHTHPPAEQAQQPHGAA